MWRGILHKNVYPAVRFWSRVNRQGPLHPVLRTRCWEWQGTKRSGYGSFMVESVWVRSHVWSWETHKGSVPSELCVLHHCDNPLCVRPSHLFLGTQVQNRRDCVAKGRQAKGRMIRTTKLTEEEVRDIRVRYALGGLGNGTPSIARDYEVRQCTIWDVVNGKTWKHVT